MIITNENLKKIGFKETADQLEYNISFANDCSIYFDKNTEEFLFEDSGYTLHKLKINSIEELKTFINTFIF